MTVETFLGLVVTALAAYRLTRIVVADSISASFRQWVWRRAYTPAGFDSLTERDVAYRRDGLRGWAWEKAFQLVVCPHCTGFWMSLGSFTLWRYGPASGRLALMALAVSGLQSFISSRPDA